VATIQVREHETLKIGSRDPVHRVLSDEQASALRRLEPTLPAGVLRWGHKQVKFRQFCGVISLGADTIEILPKIHGRETTPGVFREILIKMLYAARELTPSLHGGADIDLQRHHLLDIFINHFCGLLFSEVHKGLIKVYVEREENLPVVKGRLLIGQQLKVNLVHQERVCCQFDELQEDNLYNQAIKATLRVLFGIARASRLRQQLTELLFIFDAVQDVRVTAQDVRRLPRNRLVSRFEEIIRLCEWFLSGVSPDVVVGRSPTAALLFDMNRVFEAYVAAVMRKVTRSAGGKCKAQGPQRFLGRELTSGKHVFLLKPDLTVADSNGEMTLIADTKWKMLDAADSKYGVSQADVYQMLAYGTQYRCRRLALIYPAHSASGTTQPAVRVREGDYQIEVWDVDLAGVAGIGPSVASQLASRLRGTDESSLSLAR